jgi:CTP synthase (UTP-ammonia lyase)
MITSDKKFILEWIKKLNRADAKKIEAAVKTLTEKGINKDLDIICSSCNHGWTTKVEFDPSIFFE